MSSHPAATQHLTRDFLDTRHRILDVAAALDRIERGDGSEAVRQDPRMVQMIEALRVLVDGEPDRASRVQMIFSEPYVSNWRND